MFPFFIKLFASGVALGTQASVVWASSSSGTPCSTTLTPSNGIKPTAASGYRFGLVATGLTKPRSIVFDPTGGLLVLQSGQGVTRLSFQDGGGTCLSVGSRKNVLQDRDLNHGLALSPDGRTIYASTAEAAYSWSYDSTQAAVSDDRQTLVVGMRTDDHNTRTLLLSQKASDTLLINRGSTSNVDPEAAVISSGHSQLKAFDLSRVPDGGYKFNTQGLRLGWGLRNSVGVAEHPDTGGIYSVENSVDELMREGKDVHIDNPGEEMNFHGYLNGTEHISQGSNYGYPICFSAWAPKDLPQNANISVGTQFAIGDQTDTVNDRTCAERTPPRLTFQAHMAPLDIKFNNSGTEAWVTFHGSWDRTSPVGYKLSVIPFANGEPVAAPDNITSTTDILQNEDDSKCPQNCFRPAGIAFDNRGRLFMSSDASGEIYVISKDINSEEAGSATASSSPSSTEASESAAERTSRVSAVVLALMLLSLAKWFLV